MSKQKHRGRSTRNDFFLLLLLSCHTVSIELCITLSRFHVSCTQRFTLWEVFLMLRCFYFIRFWQPVQYTCKRTFTLITFLYISIQRTAKHTSNQNELTHSVLLEHHIQMLFLLLFRFSPSFVAQFHWLGVIFSFFTQRKILCVWYFFSFPPPCGFYSQPLFVLNEFTTMSWSTETFSTLCAVLCVCVCFVSYF